jgi:transposase-like protein
VRDQPVVGEYCHPGARSCQCRAVLALPRPCRKRLRTTNGQERLNEEARRRERMIRIFPNRESAIRLLGALLMEQDEQWSTSKHYRDMTAYWQ